MFAPSKRDSFNTRRGVRPIEIPIEKQICCDVAPHKTGVFECTKKCIFNGLSRSFEFLFSSSHSLASHPIPSTHRICDCIRNEAGRTFGAAQLLRHLMNDIVSLQPSQSSGSTLLFLSWSLGRLGPYPCSKMDPKRIRTAPTSSEAGARKPSMASAPPRRAE